jgi:hypothetical protein
MLFRENHVRAPQLTNAHMKRSRLLGLQGRPMYNMRDAPPPIRLHRFHNATSRMQQVNQEIDELSRPIGMVDMSTVFGNMLHQ